MAKTDEPIDPVTDDLMIVGDLHGVLERPKSLDRDDLTGTEDIGPEDVRLPRLAIAQGLSNQMLPDDARYIAALHLFDLFNDITEDVYGRGPLTFVPIRRDVRRIEFLPREQGGGVVDMDVPPGDPRLKWTGSAAEGNRQAPAATTFVEFIILMLRPGKAPEPIVLSIPGRNKFNRRASDNLTTFIKLRHAAIYAGLYTVECKSEKNDKGTFGTYVCKNAGFVPKDTVAGAKLFAYAEQFARSLEGKTVIVSRESDTEFDPEELERQQEER